MLIVVICNDDIFAAKSGNQRIERLGVDIPAADEDAFGDYLVLMGAIMREEMTIDWMERCLELCRNGDGR